NLKDDCGIPLIIYSASMIRPDILKLLIKAGANVNAKDEQLKKQPPLFWVIDNFDSEDDSGRFYETIEALISSGADVNVREEFGKTALISSVLLGEDRLSKMLLSAGADVNFKDDGKRTAYSYAAEAGNHNL